MRYGCSRPRQATITAIPTQRQMRTGTVPCEPACSFDAAQVSVCSSSNLEIEKPRKSPPRLQKLLERMLIKDVQEALHRLFEDWR